MKYLLRKMTAMLLALTLMLSVCAAAEETAEAAAEAEAVTAELAASESEEKEESTVKAEESVPYTDYDADALELLMSLDIIDELDPESSGEFLRGAFTRAELAVALVKFANVDTLITDGVKLKDVVKGTFEEPYIKTAVSMKLMAPVADGYFYPAYPVKYEEALQAVVMSLGYTPLAQQEDTWYLQARRLGLLNSAAAGKNLTRADMYKMLYDALHAEVMYMDGASESGATWSVSEKVDALNEYFDIKHEKGIITAAGGIELGNGSINDVDSIKINGKLMYVGKHNMKDYIGRKSVVYYNEDFEAVCILDSENNILTLDANDIRSYSNLEYAYGNKNKKARLSKPYVIINGEEYLGAYTAAAMIPESGSVTLIDNDEDGSYEIAIIDSYKDYYVKYKVTDPDSFTDSYGSSVDADDEKYTVRVFSDDGTELEFSSISEGMVATVAVSGETVTIRLSEKKIDGRLVGSGKKDGRKTWNISGESYFLSEALIDALTNGKIKEPDSLKNCTFYQNIFGEIVYFEGIVQQVGATRFYAIVAGAALAKPFGEELELKLFSKELGGMKALKAAKKVKLNGVSKEAEAVYNALRRNGLNGDTLADDETGIWAQPIKVEINENEEVIYIAQASTKDDGTEADFSYYMGSYDKTAYVKAYREIIQCGITKDTPGATFKDGPYISCDGNQYWKHIGTGRSHHTVIQVPVDTNGRIVGSSDDLFEARSISSGQDSKLIVYRVDDAIEADLILICVDDIESDHCKNEYNIRCVKSIEEELVDGMPVQSIKTDKDTYYNTDGIDLSNLILYNLGGNPQTDSEGNVKTYCLKPGDLVNVLADAKCNIVAIEAVYDHKNKKLLGDATVKDGTQAKYCNISDHEWWQRNEAGTSNEGGNLIACDILRREGSYFVGCLANAEEYDDTKDQLFLSLTPPNCVLVKEDRFGDISTGPAAITDYAAYDYAPGNHATIVMGMGWTTFNGTSFLYEHE